MNRLNVFFVTLCLCLFNVNAQNTFMYKVSNPRFCSQQNTAIKNCKSPEMYLFGTRHENIEIKNLPGNIQNTLDSLNIDYFFSEKLSDNIYLYRNLNLKFVEDYLELSTHKNISSISKKTFLSEVEKIKPILERRYGKNLSTVYLSEYLNNETNVDQFCVLLKTKTALNCDDETFYLNNFININKDIRIALYEKGKKKNEKNVLLPTLDASLESFFKEKVLKKHKSIKFYALDQDALIEPSQMDVDWFMYNFEILEKDKHKEYAKSLVKASERHIYQYLYKPEAAIVHCAIDQNDICNEGNLKNILYDRNQLWLTYFQSLMSHRDYSGKTAFVAVGYGHLFGSHSLISEMKERFGYTFEPIAWE